MPPYLPRGSHRASSEAWAESAHLELAIDRMKGLSLLNQKMHAGSTSYMLGGAKHRLEKVILTGLLDNDLHLLIVKFMSALLKPAGQMEIAKGVDGKKYRFSAIADNIIRIGEPQRIVLPLQKVSTWINQHRAPPSFDWARPFKWEDFE